MTAVGYLEWLRWHERHLAEPPWEIFVHGVLVAQNRFRHDPTRRWTEFVVDAHAWICRPGARARLIRQAGQVNDRGIGVRIVRVCPLADSLAPQAACAACRADVVEAIVRAGRGWAA